MFRHGWRTLAAAPAAACALQFQQTRQPVPYRAKAAECAGKRDKTVALVLNSGSSSVKYAVFSAEKGLNGPVIEMVCEGLVDKIGLKGCVIKHNDAKAGKRSIEGPLANHGEALTAVTALLTAPGGPIKSAADIDVVGHRVVHGGSAFSEPVVVNDEVDAVIEKCVVMAPLHNPANLMGIRMGKEIFKVPHVGVFDTAFHATMPPESYRYGLPKEVYEKYQVRRYGFHGTSYKYVSQATADIIGKPLKDLNMIILHLGNGASMCCIKDGKCVDTTMGLTPLEGLIMGTRGGDIDAGVYTYLCNHVGLSPNEVDTMMNKKSGLLGVGGLSDMREIIQAAKAGNADAQLARNMYVERIRKYIGAYLVKLDGKVDAIVWTAGVGENDREVRELCLANLTKLGIEVDSAKNRSLQDGGVISTDKSATKVMVVPTQEELCIVKQALEVTGLMPN